MSIRAGRVGVNPTDVDVNGHVKGSSDTYSKSQIDTKLSKKLNADKVGGLEFREEEGNAQYKLPDGEWTNFSSGGAGFDILWGEPTPPSLNVFRAQKINIDLSNYSKIIVCTNHSTYSSTRDYNFRNLFDRDNLPAKSFIFSKFSSDVASREITIDDSGIQINTASLNGNNPQTTSDFYCIPYMILGGN